MPLLRHACEKIDLTKKGTFKKIKLSDETRPPTTIILFFEITLFVKSIFLQERRKKKMTTWQLLPGGELLELDHAHNDANHAPHQHHGLVWL